MAHRNVELRLNLNHAVYC